MPKRNILILFVAVVASLVAWMARDRNGHGRRYAEVLAAIEDRYVEPVDQRSLFEAAMAGVFSRLDEHSGFISGADQDELNALLDQEFGGVGLELSVDEQSRRIVVLSPIAGSPAWRAGIAAGDAIEAIDGVSTATMSLSDAVARLRGSPGSAVVVQVSASSAPATLDPAAAAVAEAAVSSRTVTLLRERVTTESVLGDRRLSDGSWDWWIEGEKGVALVRIAVFGERTAAELEQALAAIESRAGADIRGLILDLRGNGGGLLAAAVDVCDVFLDDGVIVSTRGGTAADESRMAKTGSRLAGVPVVVLIDGLTASAAEIVAACLQDRGRATVVGSRSYGKGTVQSLLPLSDGSGIVKLTTAEYVRPSTTSINRRPDDGENEPWGVSPAAAFEITPTRQQIEATRSWRQARDAVPNPPPCCAAPTRSLKPPSAAPTQPAASGTLPRQADVVLARALDALRDLGGEKETAGHADKAAAPGQ